MNIRANSFYSANQPFQTVFHAKVHVLDNGTHANSLLNFAKSVFKDMPIVDDLVLHNVDCHPKYDGLKMLDSVEDKLRELLSSGIVKYGDYLTFLGCANISVTNLTDRIRDVFGKNIPIDVNNIKANSDLIFKLLGEVCSNPQKYYEQIEYMDKDKQNLSHIYNIIVLINKLRQKGVRVFIPAGHGAEHSVKWLAKKNGINNELYRYIATGKDTNNAVQNLMREADDLNFYDFNLLSLCDANIVNINDRYGKNYIFSARDGLATVSDRGVFNFTPVRDKNGTVIGYSYHDTTTVELPDKEFAGRLYIQDLNKFVGLPYTDLKSTRKENIKFRELVRKNASTARLPDKLYPISDVYSEAQIKAEKMNLLGFLTNREQDKIFDINPQGQVVFQKTNCEGSDRPSVVSMWGACFATVNAIAEHIKTHPVISQEKAYIMKSILWCKEKLSGIKFPDGTKNFLETNQ